MSEATPTRILSIVTAIETIESRLDACPHADVTPRMRASLDRLLRVPTLPIEIPEPHEPDYARLVSAATASFNRNHFVMQNLLLTFFNDCEERGAATDTASLEILHASMRGYLRIWFGAYAREIAPDGPASPVETESWSLERLIEVYQLAYAADPSDPTYQAPSIAALLEKTVR